MGDFVAILPYHEVLHSGAVSFAAVEGLGAFAALREPLASGAPLEEASFESQETLPRADTVSRFV